MSEQPKPTVSRPYLPNPCPTCGAIGDEMCVRGRKPSSVWQAKEPYPEGHNSRITANKRRSQITSILVDEVKIHKETDEYLYVTALANEIGHRIEAGRLPPQDENGFYII